MRSAKTLGFALVCAIAMAGNAHAFKVTTHVWIGQQIINDLEDDGRITLKLRGQTVTIAIRPDIVNAILNNRAAFLAGNIGPDAAPDVVVGQTVVHPGLEGAWQTYDWLQMLLDRSQNNPKGKAFTYGYLGHAAADVFAHTYTNQYSGGIFNLADETLVEQRHIALEGFIAEKNPPRRNNQGTTFQPWDGVGIDADLAAFVRDTLIYDGAARSQYLRQPFAKHLAAYQAYRNSIDNLAEDQIWRDIDIAVVQIVAQYYDVNLSEEEAGAIVDAAQPVLDFLNGDVPDAMQDAANELYDGVRRYDEQAFGAAYDAMYRMQQLEARWVNKWYEWHRKMAELIPVPNCPEGPFGVPLSPSCEAHRRQIKDTNAIILSAANVLRDLALDYKEDLTIAVNDVHTEAIKAADAVRNIRNGILDFSQIPGADVSPIQAALRAWRADVDAAMSAYVQATMQSMVNTMDRDKSAIEPIETWFRCYHLQIISVSSTISNCQFRDSFIQLYEALDKIIATINWADSLGARVGIPSPMEIERLKEEYTKQLQDRLKQEVRDQIVDILPPEVRDIIQLFDATMTGPLLNQFYTKAETGPNPKHLLMIGDMDQRVEAEMRLNSDGHFDPQRYAVVYDAIVLSKLALLDRAGLDTLAAIAGVPNNTAGSPLFGATTNVVASAFASIDGNHQWMRNQPAVPNSANIAYGESSTQYASPTGFVPWEDTGARGRLFRALFIGPVSPGIDAPEVIGKPRILTNAYPYQPCAAHPFPNDIRDRTCVAVKIAPVLQMLLE